MPGDVISVSGLQTQPLWVAPVFVWDACKVLLVGEDAIYEICLNEDAEIEINLKTCDIP